jgi:hypothetical protein
MKTLSHNFLQSAADYLYFLNRDYPQKALIKLIGDRYQLSGAERSMLYRGICSTELSRIRKGKLIEPQGLKLQWLSLDTYNVLITIGSYLNGNTVFVSNDGFLRDASEIHGKVFRSELLNRALKLVFEFLVFCEPAGIRFFIDRPVSHSGKLCALINQIISANKMQGAAETHHSPDFILKNMHEGILATSDSTIIEKTHLPLIDLPLHVLRFHFEPEFYDLQSLRMET